MLPLATVGCLGFYLIGAELAFRVGDVEVRATPTLVTGEKVRMENPRLTGFTEDRGAYVVTAASATHEFANPDLIALETINAKLTEADDGWSEVVAAAGLFDRTAKRLKLSGGIRLKTSEGLNAALLTADYLIDANRLSSGEPVTVEMPSAIVKSGALAVDCEDQTGGVQQAGGVAPEAVGGKARPLQCRLRRPRPASSASAAICRSTSPRRCSPLTIPASSPSSRGRWWRFRGQWRCAPGY